VTYRRGIAEILADYAALPLSEWSFADALLRVARLNGGQNFTVPQNLLVLIRALLLVESTVRTLDPDARIMDSIIEGGGQAIESVIQGAPETAAIARLKSEATVTVKNFPAVLGAWIHRVQREGGRIPVELRHEGLEGLESHVDRSSNRIAIALVTLGLYVAASIFMLHGAGPRVFGDIPVFAAIGYGLAFWLSLRLARSVARSGKL
jgi:ubiquinone biosynthesis protein